MLTVWTSPQTLHRTIERLAVTSALPISFQVPNVWGASSVMATQASAGMRRSAFALAALTLRRSSAANRTRSTSWRLVAALALALAAAVACALSRYDLQASAPRQRSTGRSTRL